MAELDVPKSMPKVACCRVTVMVGTSKRRKNRAGRKRQEHHRRANRGRGAGAGLCGAPRRRGITAGSDEGRAAPPRGGGGILAHGASRPFYANREKALFSHIFNKAREWGFTTARNPCRGVKGFKETGRSHYVTDEDFDRVRANAHCTVVDAMDIALLTGQRPADVLKIKRTDIRDGALWVVQNKIGARLGIEITGELAAVIDRINQRPRRAISTFLIQDENGQSLSQGALRSRFDKARTLAKVGFQFRDIRAKAATNTGDLAHSQKLLAHNNREMTEHYVKSRVGERVKPLR